MVFLAESDKPALIGPWGECSFRELRDLAARESAALDPSRPGWLAATSEPGFVARLLAYLEAGVPVAIVSPGLSEEEQRQREALLRSKLHPETALVLFTSGSTGTPKGVQLSRANLSANREAVIESLRFAAAPEQGLFLSLSYSYGLFGQLLPTLYLGIPTRVFASLVEVREHFLKGGACGMWSGVPSHWEALLRMTTPEQCARVTHVVSAGAALPLDLRERLRAHFVNAMLFNNYGLTEASPRVLCLASDHPRFFEEGTVGTAVKHLQVKAGEGGELLVKGKQVMLGYLGEAAPSRIRDGWLHSGDVVEIEPDGMVRIRGRMDDLFNIGGERTSPLEIDAALLRVPGVREGAVLPESDPLYGVRLTGFLVGEPTLTKKQVVEGLKPWLSGHKIPFEYYLVDALPRTGNGKLRRSELKERKSSGRKI